jgi:hypothetical protein
MQGSGLGGDLSPHGDVGMTAWIDLGHSGDLGEEMLEELKIRSDVCNETDRYRSGLKRYA